MKTAKLYVKQDQIGRRLSVAAQSLRVDCLRLQVTAALDEWQFKTEPGLSLIQKGEGFGLPLFFFVILSEAKDLKAFRESALK